MKKLLLAMSCAGCLSQAPKRVAVERPDPSVGDLRCHAPQISVSEWLYNAPESVHCVEE